MNRTTDIVLLHGWGCDHTIWSSVEKHLKDTHGSAVRVVSVDFPGFGAAAEPPVPWGMEEYTGWLEHFLKGRGIASPVLVGHSFGGRVALVYASRNPVGKVILVDAAGVKPHRSAGFYIKQSVRKIMKRLAPMLLGRKKAEALIERQRQRVASADYNAASPLMRQTLSKVVNEDLRRFMPLIEAPTLLVWGSRDTATPVSDARVMERLIPGAGLVVFDGAGHYSFLDRFQQFCAVVDSFLKS